MTLHEKLQYQFLIGNVKPALGIRLYVPSEWMTYQFLIGNVKLMFSPFRLRNFQSIMYQFLIGNVKQKEKSRSTFSLQNWYQFLIGNVKREFIPSGRETHEVSIPHR